MSDGPAFYDYLRVQLLHPQAQLPTRSHSDDVGLDLYVSQQMVVDPGRWVDVPIGIAVQPPAGIWYRIVGRSSTFRSRRLLVLEGIIDEGYRGELFAGVTNLGDEPAYIEVGERIAQMVPGFTLAHIVPTAVDELSQHQRGPNGFGSTGV